MAIRNDFRYAIRGLIRTPAFTLPAVLSLALGIAVNTTVFSVVSASLLRPLMPSGGEDLVRIGRSSGGARQFRSLSHEEFAYLRAHASTLDAVLGEQMETFAVGGRDGAETVSGEIVTANYFEMLRVTPVVGRGFTGQDDRGSDDAALVVSDRFWRTRLGGDPAAPGRTLAVNNVPFTISGVAPPGFAGTFPGVAIDLWLPVSMTATVKHEREARSPSMQVIGRLKEGATLETAQAELQVLARRLAGENPARDAGRGFVVARAHGVHPAFAQPLRIFLTLLMAVVAIVLLIACANVASLLLARANARRGELAVRLALGASRGRLVAELLMESLVVAALGGMSGLLLTIWPIQLLNAVFSVAGPAGEGTSLDFQLDGRVLLFTIGVTMLTALIFGLMPALQATRTDLISVVSDSRSSGQRRQSRWRDALMVVQVALSFVLLVSAVLLFRSLRNTDTFDVGFDPEHVVVASFDDLRTFGYERTRIDRFHHEFLDRVRELPGVESAAFASFVGAGAGDPWPLRVPNRTLSGDEQLTVRVGRISDGYFATVRRPLVRGRDFTARDGSGGTRVVIINESMARRFWPGEDPLGKRIGLGEDFAEHEIVGVAADAGIASYGEDLGAFVFLPAFPGQRMLHARTTAPPASMLADIKRTAHEMERNLTPFKGRTMREAMASSEVLAAVRIARVVFGVAGLIALLLASGGLYGLVSYSLQRRVKEIGIRVALGATRQKIFHVIVGGAARLTLVGVAVGIAIAAATTRLLAAFLYGVSPTDLLTFCGIATLLLAVALSAGYAAARRTLSADPTVALRQQ